MNQGIIVKKIWSDEDLIKIDVAASDGYPQHHAFAGVLGHIGGLPVPVNVTVCGDPATLSKIISVPTFVEDQPAIADAATHMPRR